METAESRIEALWRTRPKSRLLRVSVLVLSVLVLYTWLSGTVAVGDLFSARRGANLQRFLARDAIPYPLRGRDFDWGVLAEWAGQILAERGASATWTTLWIAVLAIVLAAGLATVPALLGSHSLMRRDPFGVASEAKSVPGIHWRMLTTAARVASVLLRAIPEYVWAFLFLAMFGPSAWPVVLALALHNAGILGRLGADTIENLDAAPLRSLRMLGAGRRQLAGFVVFPIALPRLLLYFFYRFETCVREATVLGMLGVVSLGYWIQEARARQSYDEMLLLVALGGGIVLGADLLSHLARAWVRRAT